jgi:hypothetical protein
VCVKASETFACWPPKSTRKKSYGHSSNLERGGLLCSPMAKVEPRETVRKGSSIVCGPSILLALSTQTSGIRKNGVTDAPCRSPC